MNTTLRASAVFRRFSIVAGISMLLGSRLGEAQQLPNPLDMSLDELNALKISSVYAASKHEQKATEAPASVTIITAEEIRRYGYRDLTDVLGHVRGFYSSFDRNYARLGSRGFNRPGDFNSRFLILIDGHRMNDVVYDAAATGTDATLDLRLIDRVEVVRGPSSSLYGTNAFFAVINLITKSSEDQPDAEVSTGTGSWSTNHGMVTLSGQPTGRTSYLVSASRYRSDGNPELYFKEFADNSFGGLARNLDADRRDSAFGRLSIGDFRLEAVAASRTKVLPTASYSTVFGNPDNHTRDWNGFVDASHQVALPKDWKLSLQGYYHWTGYDGTYAYAGAEESPLQLNRDGGRGRVTGFEGRLSKMIARRHMLTVGSELRRIHRADQFNFDMDPHVLYLDDRRQSQVSAVFAQDEFRLTDVITLSAGLRYDRYTTFGGSTNPRIALIISPDRRSALKVLYGQAFRAPNVYEMFWKQAGATKPNPNLTPERVRTAEAVFERELSSKLRVSAGGFVYRIRDLITQISDPIDGEAVFINEGRVEAKGVEFEISRNAALGVEARLSYAFQTSRSLNTGRTLSNSPQHVLQAKLGRTWFDGRLWSGSDFIALSDRRTLREGTAPAHLVPNLTIGTNRPFRGIHLTGSVYNFSNTQYGDPGSEEHTQDVIFQDGRTFRIQLSFELGSR